jgi:hydroxyacylglutathione hydrolase
MMTADLPEAPAYFLRDAEINRTGAPALGEVSRPAPLMPEEVQSLAREGHIVLDVRAGEEFGAGHVPGALNVGLGGQFASWAGSLVAPDAPVIVVAEADEQIDEAVKRLARVGLENVKGYLRGGMLAWVEAGLAQSRIPQITVGELRELLWANPDLQVVDVRRSAEYASGHVPRAASAPLSSHLDESLSQLNPELPTAVICAGGYRSSAAASILSGRGFRQLLNVAGGTVAWASAGFPIEQ